MAQLLEAHSETRRCHPYTSPMMFNRRIPLQQIQRTHALVRQARKAIPPPHVECLVDVVNRNDVAATAAKFHSLLKTDVARTSSLDSQAINEHEKRQGRCFDRTSPQSSPSTRTYVRRLPPKG